MIFPKPKSLKTGRVGILPTSIFLSRENFGATELRGGEREERVGNLNSETKKFDFISFWKQFSVSASFYSNLNNIK